MININLGDFEARQLHRLISNMCRQHVSWILQCDPIVTGKDRPNQKSKEFQSEVADVDSVLHVLYEKLCAHLGE